MILIFLFVFEGLGFSITDAGMGGTMVGVRDCALQTNQAALSYREGIQFKYSYNRGFSTLVNHRADFSWNGLGVGLISRVTPDEGSETDLSRETEFRFAHGIKLIEGLRFGYSVNAYHYWIKGFGKDITLGFDGSLLAEIYEDWVLGINAHNFNRPTMGDENPYDLPWSFSAGISYNPYPGVISHLAFTREEDYPLQVHFGQKFTLSDNLILLTGIKNEPVRLSLGTEIKTDWFSFHYAIQNHQRLPLEHWIGVSYR